jgi:hypothetical protein
LHETRRFIGQDPPVIVKIGRQLTSQLAEKLSNLSDLWLKHVVLRLSRQVGYMNGLLTDKKQLQWNDLRRRA